MLLILDGSSEHGAHIWNLSGIAIFERHLVTSKESSNPIFLSENTFLLHICATCSDQPSYISAMESMVDKRVERWVKYSCYLIIK